MNKNLEYVQRKLNYAIKQIDKYDERFEKSGAENHQRLVRYYEGQADAYERVIALMEGRIEL